jgi:hypothetical protein
MRTKVRSSFFCLHDFFCLLISSLILTRRPQTVEVNGGGTNRNCKAGWHTRYPAAGAHPLALVPIRYSALPTREWQQCPAYTRPAADAASRLANGRCGASAVPTAAAARRLFYARDRNIMYLDRGSSDLMESVGPGLLSWCGFDPTCYKQEPVEVTISTLDQSPRVPITGPVLVSVLLFTVTFYANHAHNLTRSP